MTIDEFMRDIALKMRPGWIAMSPSDDWYFYSTKPKIVLGDWHNFLNASGGYSSPLYMFDIDPVDDWTKSLQKVGCKTDPKIELEKKLEIAVNALKWIEEQSDTSTQYDYDAEAILKNIVFDAQQALKEIK